MKILQVGGGGREHALVWKIAQSPLVKKIYCAPGNPGTAQLAENVNIAADDLDGLLKFANQKNIDLVVVGPELPLSLGIVDLFRKAGHLVFGPSQMAAEIESSKAFSKSHMRKYGVPTANYGVFEDVASAMKYLDGRGNYQVAVKPDGLTGGKGVTIVQTRGGAMKAISGTLGGNLGKAGNKVVVEQFLKGQEASFLAYTDGKIIIPLASAQDHKSLYDGDLGPNTGGMGAYSPAPVVTQDVHNKVMTEVMHKTIDGMAAEGRPYQGVLYAGLMIDGAWVNTLEFNCRFGDPECQPLMMRMKSDIVPILLAVAKGDLSGVPEIEWDSRHAVCVVLAAEGYPGDYSKGAEITGIEAAEALGDVVVFHAGTKLVDGKLVTAGGRVLGVTALGNTIKEAIDRAYEANSHIHFDGKYYRRDIGQKALQEVTYLG